MPPCTTTITRTIEEEIHHESSKSAKPNKNSDISTLWGYFPQKLKWFNIISITLVHCVAAYALGTCPYFEHKRTVLFSYFVGFWSGFGITGGAHRFWSHKSYKATTPLKIILIIGYAFAGQNRLYDWVRDHRVHHKFSETDADPHNAKRGFFFAHVGWLMMNKHPDVKRKGRSIDCSDVLEEPVAAFFERHFWSMKMSLCFILPVLVPCYCWNETFYWSFMCCIARYVVTLNTTWSVNSAAHFFGNKPYDKRIQPTENLTVSIVSMGEGWHNYHHTFPWDYKAAELSSCRANMTTGLIDLFAKIGWAYDLKTPSDELVRKMILKYGDGSHETHKGHKIIE